MSTNEIKTPVIDVATTACVCVPKCFCGSTCDCSATCECPTWDVAGES
jgi:hypothetical protein